MSNPVLQTIVSLISFLFSNNDHPIPELKETK